MTKGDLFEIIELARKNDRAEEHLAELREIARTARAVDTTKERAGGADARAGMALIEKIIDLESSKRSDQNRLNRLRKMAKKEFDRLHGLEKEIMMRRYVDVLKWGDVSMIVGYDLRYVYRLHKKALEKLFDHVRALT